MAIARIDRSTRGLDEATRRDLKILLERARVNNDPPREMLQRLVGREAARSFTYALEVLRKTGDKRESGHASIAHSLEIMLGMAGLANSYGIVKRAGEPVEYEESEIVTPSHLMQMKGEAYFIEALSTVATHDVVEDSSKSPRELEDGFEKLRQALSAFGNDFSRRVTAHVRLLTNRYARMLKGAKRFIPQNGNPFESVRTGLERSRDDLTQELGGYSRKVKNYAAMIDQLLHDLENLAEMRSTIEKRYRAAYFSHTSSVEGVVNYLSYRAYSHFIRDLVRACMQNFTRWDDHSDIPILGKWGDSKNNTETTNISRRDKIRRSLAKAEMVERGIDNGERTVGTRAREIISTRMFGETGDDDRLPLEQDVAMRTDHAIGWIQFLEQRDANQEYIDIWEALSEELRCLIIRACVIRRKALELLDAHSMSGEMGPFLMRLEHKYRNLYLIGDDHGSEDQDVGVIRQNPIGDLWQRRTEEIVLSE